MPVIGVTPLDESHLDEAASVLGRAFFADPLERYLVPADGERIARSSARFRNILRYGLSWGEVHTASSRAITGVAMWLPPGATEMTDERMEQAGMFELPSIVGREAFLRFIAVLEVLDQFHTSDVDPLHWYLLVVGVDPVQQQQGIGAALVQPVLARADADGLPCYLETTNEGNVGFYMHLGFRVVHDVVEPVSGLRLWTLRRDPSLAEDRSAHS